MTKLLVLKDTSSMGYNNTNYAQTMLAMRRSKLSVAKETNRRVNIESKDHLKFYNLIIHNPGLQLIAHSMKTALYSFNFS